VIAIRLSLDAGSAQIKPMQCERSRHHFLRFFAELPVKLRMTVRIHATLEDFPVSVDRSKKPRRDPQSADPVT